MPERFLTALDGLCSDLGTGGNNVFASGIVRTSFEAYAAVSLAFGHRFPHLFLQAYDTPTPYGFFKNSLFRNASDLIIHLSTDVHTFEDLPVRYIVAALIRQRGTHIIRICPKRGQKTSYHHPLESDGLDRLLTGNPTLGMSAQALRTLVRRHPLPPFQERTLPELIEARPYR